MHIKTKEELNGLIEEVEALNIKLAELNGEELAQVCGGNVPETQVPLGSRSLQTSLSTNPPKTFKEACNKQGSFL